MKYSLLIPLYVTILSTLSAQHFEGDWHGEIQTAMGGLPIVLHIQKTEGEYTSTLDSPKQNKKGIPVDETRIKGRRITLSLASIRLRYEGEWDKQQELILGKMTQNGITTPLSFGRTPIKQKVKRRKQEPTTFPYIQEEVVFKNNAAGIILAGTLTIPEGHAPEKAVILISGSGAQDRNSDLGPINHRPFLVWSDYLTRKGIAVLRYDERGVGASAGDFHSATSADLATDVHAAVAFIRQHPSLSNTRIGLVGHSEGGIIAPMVASENKDVAFIVTLAGPGVPGDELLLLQNSLLGKNQMIPDKMLKEMREGNLGVYEYVKKTQTLDKEEFQKGLCPIIERNVAAASPFLLGGQPAKEVVASRLAIYSSPWMRYFINLDPAPYWASTTCPVLALNGASDLQVDAEQNIPAITKALKRGDNEQATTKIYPRMNHLFQVCKTGSPSEYGELEETVNQQVMDDVVEWISSQH